MDVRNIFHVGRNSTIGIINLLVSSFSKPTSNANSIQANFLSQQSGHIELFVNGTFKLISIFTVSLETDLHLLNFAILK